MSDKPTKRLPLSLVDGSRVDAAVSHLQKLFSDPYYREAYERLRRKEELPKALPGPLPPKGVLARRFRWSSNVKPTHVTKKRAAFSVADNQWIDALLQVASEKGLSLSGLLGRFLRREFPNVDEQAIEKNAKRLAKQIHNRKNYLTRTSEI